MAADNRYSQILDNAEVELLIKNDDSLVTLDAKGDFVVDESKLALEKLQVYTRLLGKDIFSLGKQEESRVQYGGGRQRDVVIKSDENWGKLFVENAELTLQVYRQSAPEEISVLREETKKVVSGTKVPKDINVAKNTTQLFPTSRIIGGKELKAATPADDEWMAKAERFVTAINMLLYRGFSYYVKGYDGAYTDPNDEIAAAFIKQNVQYTGSLPVPDTEIYKGIQKMLDLYEQYLDSTKQPSGPLRYFDFKTLAQIDRSTRFLYAVYCCKTFVKDSTQRRLFWYNQKQARELLEKYNGPDIMRDIYVNLMKIARSSELYRLISFYLANVEPDQKQLPLDYQPEPEPPSSGIKKKKTFQEKKKNVFRVDFTDISKDDKLGNDNFSKLTHAGLLFFKQYFLDTYSESFEAADPTLVTTAIKDAFAWTQKFELAEKDIALLRKSLANFDNYERPDAVDSTCQLIYASLTVASEVQEFVDLKQCKTDTIDLLVAALDATEFQYKRLVEFFEDLGPYEEYDIRNILCLRPFKTAEGLVSHLNSIVVKLLQPLKYLAGKVTAAIENRKRTNNLIPLNHVYK